ncbi:MAG: hypothetical protein ACI9YH_004139 [Colwellia sp.]|jgi:hypothetical protein
MNYIVERKFGHFTPLEALNNVIEADGNHLVMAYGYIYSSEVIDDIFDTKIINFLKKSDNNKVSIFVGLFKKDKAEKLEELKRLEEHFENMLPKIWYEQGLSQKVSVFGIKNFHPKFSIMYNSTGGDQKAPVAALMGSSNMSYSAIGSKSRFELDILMLQEKEENQLLNSLSSTALKMLNASIKRQDVRLAERVKDNIHWRHVREEEVIAEIFRSEANRMREQEYYDNKYYTRSAFSPEDGVALHESDVEQGICSEYERSKTDS